MHLALAKVTIQESAADVVGVRQIIIGGSYHCQFLARFVLARRRPAAGLLDSLVCTRQANAGAANHGMTDRFTASETRHSWRLLKANAPGDYSPGAKRSMRLAVGKREV